MFRTALFLSCVCFLALGPRAIKGMTEEQKETIKQHFEAAGMECIKDFPITEKDIADVRSKNPNPTGEGVPCFLACMMKKIGLMDAAGAIQKETVLDLAKKVFNDEEELKRIGEYLHSCAHVNTAAVTDGEKGCQRAMLAYKCMTENSDKFNIDI